MSAEDRAWCERAAERGFWRQWEQLNRRDEMTATTVDRAKAISARYPSPPANRPLLKPDSQLEAG